MPKKLIVPIQKKEWYQHFIEECKAIIVETRFNSTIELLRGKWELGKRVTEEELNFQRAGYGKKIIEITAAELGMSAVHLWKCVQFYKKFPFKEFQEVLNALPEGKVINWYKVYKLYLPKHREEIAEEERWEKLQTECSHPKLKCQKCKKEFDWFELLRWVEEEKRKL